MTSPADSSNASSSLPENATPSGTAARAPAAATPQEVLWIHRWTPSLLSLRVTRDSRFRFTPGHYARLGLPDSSGPAVFRPLSITSAPAEAHLEFFCTLVTGGAFSSLLDRCRVGDPVQVEKASYGFLTLDALAPGHDLWLIASGSGLGPYLSILRDPEVWSAFARIVVVHSVRRAAELAYAEELEHFAQQRSATTAAARLHYLPVVTREPGGNDPVATHSSLACGRQPRHGDRPKHRSRALASDGLRQSGDVPRVARAAQRTRFSDHTAWSARPNGFRKILVAQEQDRRHHHCPTVRPFGALAGSGEAMARPSISARSHRAASGTALDRQDYRLSPFIPQCANRCQYSAASDFPSQTQTRRVR
jgi:ferredoxin-NADP reductase